MWSEIDVVPPRTAPWLAAAGVALVLAGCGREFALPKGDADRGRDTFVELRCNTCHSVGSIEQVGADGSPPIHKRLGGKVSTVKSYEDLVTSIINPSHRVSPRYPEDTVREISDKAGNSRMPSYNEVMTVQQLVDLVAFLQREYHVSVPRRDYPGYSR